MLKQIKTGSCFEYINCGYNVNNYNCLCSCPSCRVDQRNVFSTAEL